MEEKRDNKEIRVRLHHIDRGNCTEVWEVQTEKGKPRRYLGRDDGYGPKEWYTLCDAPYGYCERDCHVREDLTLIVCDKDWNEVLKAKNGAPALPAVPNKHKEEYHRQAKNLQYLKCRPDKLTSQIYAAFKNEQYKYLAEYALAGSAFFIDKSFEKDMFAKLRAKLKAEYKPYTDKGKAAAKQRNL